MTLVTGGGAGHIDSVLMVNRETGLTSVGLTDAELNADWSSNPRGIRLFAHGRVTQSPVGTRPKLATVGYA